MSRSAESKLIRMIRQLDTRRNHLRKLLADRPKADWAHSELDAINFAIQFMQENADLATELLRTKDEQRKKLLNKE